MNKNILIIIGALLLFASIFILKRSNQTVMPNAHTIGILQTASHPALDACKDAFIEELQSHHDTNFVFISQNAQGSVSQAHSIAQQFHANKQVNLFYTIATPAAQAMSALEKERPLVIAAVTDPHALGLISKDGNVCGVTDMIDVKGEIEMLTELLPSAKVVGLLYTSGEINSIALAEQMKQELEARGLNPIDFALSSETDVQAMVELACRKCDVILAPTDNTVASTISAITAITAKYKKPLIVSDNMLVKFGALAARGVDYKASGKRAAQIAYMVLKEGKHPSELPIKQVPSEQIVINQSVLQALGLTIPESLQKQIVFVE